MALRADLRREHRQLRDRIRNEVQRLVAIHPPGDQPQQTRLNHPLVFHLAIDDHRQRRRDVWERA